MLCCNSSLTCYLIRRNAIKTWNIIRAPSCHIISYQNDFCLYYWKDIILSCLVTQSLLWEGHKENIDWKRKWLSTSYDRMPMPCHENENKSAVSSNFVHIAIFESLRRISDIKCLTVVVVPLSLNRSVKSSQFVAHVARSCFRLKLSKRTNTPLMWKNFNIWLWK